ncbi:MAG: hypothetical protein AAFP23_09105 [Pseudomonadota bacterium]
MDRAFEGARLDVAQLARSMGPGSTLSINTVRKADLRRLQGLDTLPLASLSLRWLSAPDLSDIPLPPTLKELRIWHSNKLVSLSGIEAAGALERLELRGNGALREATALRQLERLESLSISGDPPSLQKIVSLDFLEGLPLRHLAMSAVEGKALDLGPVARLSGLQSLELHGPNFAPEELAKVAAAHASFYARLMQLPDASSYEGPCKKCGGKKKVLFLAGKKGLWCPACEDAKLKDVLDWFRALVAASAP